jgi:phosphoglycerol transferase MdoB-like AlkP superfamily enzyme
MEKKGYYSVLASLVTSFVIVLVFYVLAAAKVRENSMYTNVDVYAGMVFVFILSMIVSASIWPGIIEKRLKHMHFCAVCLVVTNS